MLAHEFSLEMPHSAARIWALFDQTGTALELVIDVTAERGYRYTMLSHDGNDRVGHIRLEPIGPNRTMFHFDETTDIDPAIYEFINKHNEDSMRAASQYLSDHPEYRSDLVEA